MGSEQANLKAIHSLTLVQRCAVFRASLAQTTNAVGTRIVFQTNELMHVIASVWSISSIRRAVDHWHNEIAKLANQIPRHQKSQMEWSIKIARGNLEDLIENQKEHKPIAMQ